MTDVQRRLPAKWLPIRITEEQSLTVYQEDYMKIKVLSLVLVAMLMLMTAMPALADDDTTGTITIGGGDLSIVPQAIHFDVKTLNGTLLSSDGTTDEWVATDPTGTGAGWHLTVVATDFTAAGGKVIPAEGLQMQLLDSAIAKADPTSSDVPASTLTTFTAIDTVRTFATAAAEAGMGSYNMMPTFKLAIPANTKIGDYTSTVTVQIVAAPQ